MSIKPLVISEKKRKEIFIRANNYFLDVIVWDAHYILNMTANHNDFIYST